MSNQPKEESLQKFVQSDSLRGEIVKVLPKHITPERFARIAWTSVVRNPALGTCDRNSLATAILLCAQAGLEPDGRLAHLVPFGNKVQVIYDYKGIVTLAKRNGVDVKASLIYDKDTFSYLEDDGTGKTVVHHSFNPIGNRGVLIGVYSRASEKDKVPDYEFMSVDEVEAVRGRSRAKDSGPWKTDYGEMVKKTVIKRHSKRWDLLPEIREVINAEDDTPPPLNIVTTSRPIFDKAPEQLPENGEQVQPEAVPMPVEQPPASGVAQQERQSGFNPVKAVRALCKEGKIKESAVIGFLFEIGSASANYDTLEQLHLSQPELLQTCCDQWSDISKRILAVTGAA